MGERSFFVEEQMVYNEHVAHMVAELLPQLSPRFANLEVNDQWLDVQRFIVESPSHAQFLEWDNTHGLRGKLVGIGTLSLVLGPGAGTQARLEDFVVDESTRGTGAADLLWGAFMDWCNAKHANTLGFTSKRDRVEAHKFYKRMGAVVKDTTVFGKAVDLA